MSIQVGNEYSLIVFTETPIFENRENFNCLYFTTKSYSVSHKTGHLSINTVYGKTFKYNMGKVSTNIEVEGIVPCTIISDVKQVLDRNLFVTTTRGSVPLYLWIRKIDGNFLQFRQSNSDIRKNYIKVNIDGYNYSVQENSTIGRIFYKL